jgi:glycosyltransferase involved in cell wall biosynthesis
MATRRLKIFHCPSNLAIGGIEAMLVRLTTFHDAARFDVRAYNFHRSSLTADFWHERGIPGYRIDCSPAGLPMARAAYALFRRERPDVVMIYGLRAAAFIRPAAWLAGVPLVLTGLLGLEPFRRWGHTALELATLPFVDRYVANCRACKDWFVREQHLPAAKVDIIYDGIDAETSYRENVPDAEVAAFRRECRLGPEHVVVVSVANLRAAKGYNYLVEAAARLKAQWPHLRYLCVGADYLDGQIQRQAQAAGLGQQFIFTGPRQDIPALLKAADVFTLPSNYEGLPISLQEAMAAGLPVLASNVGGIAELVDSGVNGILVAKGDVPALAEGLRRLAADQTLRRSMGLAGRARVAEKFTIRRMVREYEEYYIKQLRGKGRLPEGF